VHVVWVRGRLQVQLPQEVCQPRSKELPWRDEVVHKYVMLIMSTLSDALDQWMGGCLWCTGTPALSWDSFEGQINVSGRLGHCEKIHWNRPCATVLVSLHNDLTKNHHYVELDCHTTPAAVVQRLRTLGHSSHLYCLMHQVDTYSYLELYIYRPKCYSQYRFTSQTVSSNAGTWNSTAWWQRQMCVNNLSKVALDSAAAGIESALFRLSNCRLLVAERFPAAAATIWNALRDNVVSASPFHSFWHQLKTFLCSSDLSSW